MTDQPDMPPTFGFVVNPQTGTGVATGSNTPPASTAPLAASLPLVQGRCPACGRASLFLGNGGHVTCSIIDCPNPSLADDLLHGQAQANLADALGGGRTARLLAHTLHIHGRTLAAVRAMTDEQLLAVPGIQGVSLALIRESIPGPAGTEATEPAHQTAAEDAPPVQCWHTEADSPCDWDVCKQPERLAAGDYGTDPRGH